MKNTIKGVDIVAISSFLPEDKVSIRNLFSELEESELNRIISTTGIENIRVCDGDMTSSDMCYNAAQVILKSSICTKEDIDGLVFVSQTPDYKMPSTSTILQDRLGLSNECVCQDINYGCSGYIYGLLQASLWISTGCCKNVLVLAGDTTTRIINSKNRSERMVFGDAATATLLRKGNAELSFNIKTDGSGYDKLIVPAGGSRLPISEETNLEYTDLEGNVRTKNDLFMDGMSIFSFVISKVPKLIKESLPGDKINDVDLFAFHQANHLIVSYLQKKLKLDIGKVPINVRDYGNTGPATIPLLLSDTYGSQQGECCKSLNKCCLSGFGIGLSWGCVICDLSSTMFFKPINK